MNRATVRARLTAAKSRKAVENGSVSPGGGSFRAPSPIPPSPKKTSITQESTPQPRTRKRSAPCASVLSSPTEVRPSKVAKGPQRFIKFSIPDGSHYLKHQKDIDDTRPHPCHSLWNVPVNANFVFDEFIGKEEHAKMDAAGELEVCRATISYALQVAAMGSHLEACIANRDKEKTEVTQELAEVGGIQGHRRLVESEASLRKRAESFELIQKDLSRDLDAARRKLITSSESLKIAEARRDSLLELQILWDSEREALKAKEEELHAQILDVETQEEFAFKEGFQAAQAQVNVLAPELDLSPMDMFKVVRDGQIVE